MIKSTGANTVHYLAEQMEKLGTALGELVLHFKLASTLKVLNELQLSNSNFALTCCLNVLWMNSAVGIKVCALHHAFDQLSIRIPNVRFSFIFGTFYFLIS